MPGIAIPDDAVPMFAGPVDAVADAGEVNGQEVGALGRQETVGFEQAMGKAGAVAVNVHARRLVELAEPLLISFRRHVRLGWGNAETFQRDQFFDAFRSDAGIQAGQNAAHAMAGQSNLTGRCVMIEDGFQIAEMFGEKIRAAQPFRRAETAPVGGDDIPVLLQFIDDKLE